MFPKNCQLNKACHFDVEDGVSNYSASMLLIWLNFEIFDNCIAFPSPGSFFFFFPFPSLLRFRSFSGLRNMPFYAFSLKWLQISLGWFSRNWLDFCKECCQSDKACHFHVVESVSNYLASMLLIWLDHCFQRILPIRQSMPFRCGRWCFKLFGITAAHLAGSSFPNNTSNQTKRPISMWSTAFQIIWHQCCSFGWIIVSKQYFQSDKACLFDVVDCVSNYLAPMLLIWLDHQAGFLITVLRNKPFVPNSFFAH